MARPQPSPASSKKTANTTTTTTGTRSSFSKSLASFDQVKNTKPIRLSLRTSTMYRQQDIQPQKDQHSTKSQRPPQQLSSYNGKDGNQHKKDADAGERILKKRRLSKPYRTQEDVDDSESDKDEPQERDRPSGSGAAVGNRGRTHRALACNEATDAAQDDEGTDTDDFQTRPGPTWSMIRGRRHGYGQIHGSSSNNTATTTIRRDLSKMAPYPEHLLSTLPERPARRLSAQTRETTNISSPPNPATQAPSRNRPLSRVPSHISDTPRRASDMTTTTTMRKPKAEETDDECGPVRSSQSLPVGGPPHESDVYKAMEDHGTDLWRDWCKKMAYSDKDRVTALKLKDYIDFEAMPKDREMMRKSWRLPGHPEFIAVSALEAYIRPVVNLWYEQSLEAELKAIRDAKLKSTRSQQPQQPLQPPTPPTPNSQPRQAKPKLRQPQLQLPPKATFASTNQQLVKTIAIHTITNRAEGTTEGKENAEKEGKEAKGKKEIGEQEKDGTIKDDDRDRENNTSNNRDDRADICGDHTTSGSSETNGEDPTGKDEERDAAAERIPATTLKLVASSTPTLPTASSIPVPASPPSIPPPTPPSSQPPAGENQIRAKDIQLLRMLDLASLRIDVGLSDGAIKHQLNPRVTTIADVLTEWTVGIEGGPSIQQLNSDYGLFWQHSDDEKEYSGREAIVREFKRLVFDEGKTDQQAQKLLEDELASSSKADLVARLRTSRRASLSSLTAV